MHPSATLVVRHSESGEESTKPGEENQEEKYRQWSMELNSHVSSRGYVKHGIKRGYHEKQGPIAGLTMVGPLTVAQTKAGAAMIPFALDHGVWTANADKISQGLKAQYKVPGFNGNFELWVTGTLSARAKKELVARGFTVTEQVGPRLDIVD